MPFHILEGDITRIHVDAIVNAANNSLLGGGGVDGAIHRAAGPRLLEECRTLHGCKTGEAKATLGYDLPAKYVIHTVGPIWQGGGCGEEELLRSAYRNSLNLAIEKNCESVAFPLISSGVYGYPLEQALDVAVSTIRDFLAENEMDVTLVIFDRRSFRLNKELHANLSGFVDHVYDDGNAGTGGADRLVGSAGAFAAGGAIPPQAAAAQAMPDAAMMQAMMGNAAAAQAMRCAPAAPMADADALTQHAEAKKERRSLFSNLKKSSAKRAVCDSSKSEESSGGAVAAEEPVCGAPASEPVCEEVDLECLDEEVCYGVAESVRVKDDLAAALRNLDESFSQALLRMIDARGMKDSECYKKANIDRKLFSKIRSDVNYRPSKQTVLAFAVALELDLAETRAFLQKAGFALSRSNKADVIVEYFIANGIYDMYSINEALFAYDQNLLGA